MLRVSLRSSPVLILGRQWLEAAHVAMCYTACNCEQEIEGN